MRAPLGIEPEEGAIRVLCPGYQVPVKRDRLRLRSRSRSPPRGAGARTQAEAIAFDRDLIPGTEYAYGPFFRLDSERSAHRRAAPQLLPRRAPRAGAHRDHPVGVLPAPQLGRQPARTLPAVRGPRLSPHPRARPARHAGAPGGRRMGGLVAGSGPARPGVGPTVDPYSGRRYRLRLDQVARGS